MMMKLLLFFYQGLAPHLFSDGIGDPVGKPSQAPNPKTNHWLKAVSRISLKQYHDLSGPSFGKSVGEASNKQSTESVWISLGTGCLEVALGIKA